MEEMLLITLVLSAFFNGLIAYLKQWGMWSIIKIDLALTMFPQLFREVTLDEFLRYRDPFAKTNLSRYNCYIEFYLYFSCKYCITLFTKFCSPNSWAKGIINFVYWKKIVLFIPNLLLFVCKYWQDLWSFAKNREWLMNFWATMALGILVYPLAIIFHIFYGYWYKASFLRPRKVDDTENSVETNVKKNTKKNAKKNAKSDTTEQTDKDTSTTQFKDLPLRMRISFFPVNELELRFLQLEKTIKSLGDEHKVYKAVLDQRIKFLIFPFVLVVLSLLNFSIFDEEKIKMLMDSDFSFLLKANFVMNSDIFFSAIVVTFLAPLLNKMLTELLGARKKAKNVEASIAGTPSKSNNNNKS